MFGRKELRLSSLQGKVVLVDFWSAEWKRTPSTPELKEVYAEYADRDSKFTRSVWMFRRYLDQRRAGAALPWISGLRFPGRNSPALGLYNVQKLPANF